MRSAGRSWFSAEVVIQRPVVAGIPQSAMDDLAKIETRNGEEWPCKRGYEKSWIDSVRQRIEETR